MGNEYTGSDSVAEFLEHYGILGMKWGRRRSRRELQAARGKKKWEEDDYTGPSEDHKRQVELSRKKVSEMSNSELSAYNTRRQLENTYYQNLANQRKAERTLGQKFVDAAIEDSISIGRGIAKEYSKKAAKHLVNELLSTTATGKKIVAINDKAGKKKRDDDD